MNHNKVRVFAGSTKALRAWERDHMVRRIQQGENFKEQVILVTRAQALTKATREGRQNEGKLSG